LTGKRVERRPADNLEPRFAEAQRLHTAGNLAGAERVYREMLAADPHHIGALHYLGVLAHQAGRHDEAVSLIEAALKQSPDDPGILTNLANACRDQGRPTEAVVYAGLALELRPGLIEAHTTLASVLLAAGRPAEALAQYRRVLELHPHHAGARLGASEAIAGLQVPRISAPSYDSARAAFGLASELSRRERRFAARGHYEAAVRLQPENPLHHIGLGTLCHEWDELETAHACFERASTLDPNSAQALCNLGITLHELGRHQEALDIFAKAEILAPDHALVHWNKALSLLTLGRWRDGWAEHEWRWQLPNKQVFPHDAWDGGALDGKTILLHAEQGLGDTLQCLRYVPMVKAKGARVLLLCGLPLHRLLRHFPGIDLLIQPGAMPPFDVQVPLFGLPHLFETMPDTVPAPVPFAGLTDDGAAAARIRAASGLRIGIVWAGSPNHPNDMRRSCPLAAFAPLFEIPGCSFFSLQKGAAEREIDKVAFGSKLVPLGAQLGDLADTAAALGALDLLISVDTAVAHLAGTLHIPAWLLLPQVADWRWLVGRDDSPWYPSMRLFRQHRRSDWAGVLRMVAAALATIASTGR
jgi:tetratricopeptide (TPR) repeat protein